MRFNIPRRQSHKKQRPKHGRSMSRAYETLTFNKEMFFVQYKDQSRVFNRMLAFKILTSRVLHDTFSISSTKQLVDLHGNGE